MKYIRVLEKIGQQPKADDPAWTKKYDIQYMLFKCPLPLMFKFYNKHLSLITASLEGKRLLEKKVSL